MPPAPIFARVQPKSIKINEKYGYRANISNNLSVEKKKKEKPKSDDTAADSFEVEGTIKIEIPYDGHQHFTTQALDDIKRQVPSLWAGVSQADVKAQVGFLAVSEVGKSNLPKKHNLGYHNVLPLEIVIKSGPPPAPTPPSAPESIVANDPAPKTESPPPKPPVLVSQPADLQENRFGATLEYAYEPEPLARAPLHPHFRVYDEPIHDQLDDDEWEAIERIREANKKNANPPKGSLKKLEKVVEILKGQEEFKNSLVFDLRWDLTLPAALGKALGDALPEVERFAIQWPIPISPRRLTLRIKDKPSHLVRYDPEKQVLEWRNLPFVLSKTPEEGKDYTYHTPMTLTVERPEELYRYAFSQNPGNGAPTSIQEALNNLTLSGEMKVKVTQALSGLKLEHFSATGAKGTVEAKGETILNIDFAFDLDDLFNHRANLPYQYLELGVPCDLERVMLIATILENLGFDVLPIEVEPKPHEPIRYVMAARRQGALEKLWVWMLITWPKPAAKPRPKNALLLADYEATQDSTPQPATLYMRGRLLEGKTNLIEVMNEIHKRIRHKLQPISMVEEVEL